MMAGADRILLQSALAVLVVVVVLSTCPTTSALFSRPRPVTPASPLPPHAEKCKELWFQSYIDHFGFSTDNKYAMRYFVCDDAWDPSKGGIMHFYTGNESPVTNYLYHDGFLFESAPEFGALVVFAEHRYFGESLPFGNASFTPQNLRYLTSEQAMADYAYLLTALRQEYNLNKVIAFGGSYGGMLSAWMRLRYPALIDGAIAASAPVMAFQQRPTPWDTEKYWAVVTRDASAAGGATDQCSSNIRSSWKPFFDMAATDSGRHSLSSLYQLCTPLASEYDAWRLAMFVMMAIDTMAMGEYPYPSSYLTAGGPPLPAWPVRAACETSGLNKPLSGNDLLSAVSRAAGVFNNGTKDQPCYTLPEDTEDDGIWDWVYCTEMIPQESYFARDGVNDMFWPSPFNFTFITEHCQKKYGVTPRPAWLDISYGFEAYAKSSNIVFSNGLLDPWSSGGITTNLSDTVQAVTIELGAHHLDLFTSNPADPPCVKAARDFEVANIRKWVQEK